MKLSSRVLLFVAIGVTVVLVIGLFFLLVFPQISKLSALGVEITQAESDIQTAQLLLKQRQSVKARSAETETKLLRLANELPESPELPSLLIELHDTVNESGLELNSLTPARPVDDPAGFSAIRIDITAVGNWQDTIDFLHRLNRLTRQVDVDAVTALPAPAEVTDEGEEIESDKLKITVSLRAFAMAPPAATPAVPAPGAAVTTP